MVLTAKKDRCQIIVGGLQSLPKRWNKVAKGKSIKGSEGSFEKGRKKGK